MTDEQGAISDAALADRAGITGPAAAGGLPGTTYEADLR
jgi:hypothetical protein